MFRPGPPDAPATAPGRADPDEDLERLVHGPSGPHSDAFPRDDRPARP